MFKVDLDFSLLARLQAVIQGNFTKFNSYNTSKPINSNKRTKSRGKVHKRVSDNTNKWYAK